MTITPTGSGGNRDDPDRRAPHRRAAPRRRAHPRVGDGARSASRHGGPRRRGGDHGALLGAQPLGERRRADDARGVGDGHVAVLRVDHSAPERAVHAARAGERRGDGGVLLRDRPRRPGVAAPRVLRADPGGRLVVLDPGRRGSHRSAGGVDGLAGAHRRGRRRRRRHVRPGRAVRAAARTERHPAVGLLHRGGVRRGAGAPHPQAGGGVVVVARAGERVRGGALRGVRGAPVRRPVLPVPGDREPRAAGLGPGVPVPAGGCGAAGEARWAR